MVRPRRKKLDLPELTDEEKAVAARKEVIDLLLLLGPKDSDKVALLVSTMFDKKTAVQLLNDTAKLSGIASQRKGLLRMAEVFAEEGEE